MLRISEQQMQAQREALQARLENRLYEHACSTYPIPLRLFGPDCLRQLVRLSMRKTTQCAFISEEAHRLFLRLVLECGVEFDNDPALAFPGPALATRAPERQRFAQLASAADQYSAKTEPGMRGAAFRFRKFPTAWPASDQHQYAKELVRCCGALFPEKASLVPNDAWTSLSAKAAAEAAKRAWRSLTAHAVLSALFFSAGCGLLADPRGAAILRDPQIIAALTGPALAFNEAARDEALTALHEFVPASSLAPHAETLTADFEKFPTSSSFLVLAKAKPAPAGIPLRKIATTPRWKDDSSARIALAAYGDQAVERSFTDPLASIQDPREFARLARQTGWIGTPTALRALADQVRTSLIFEIPNAVKRSSRLDVIAALSFNFPEEPALFANNITSEQSYDDVESFCRRQFGAKWSKPRPPFLVNQPFPF